jgi:hypothetical protein
VEPRLFVAAALEGLAVLASQPEHAALAARLLGAASALPAEMGAPVRSVDRDSVEQVLATARSALSARAFAAVWAEAQALPLEQIVCAIPGLAVFAADGALSGGSAPGS